MFAERRDAMPVRAMERIKSQLFSDFSRFPFPGNVDQIARDFLMQGFDEFNFKNVGERSLESESVHLRFWYYEWEKFPSANASFL